MPSSCRPASSAAVKASPMGARATASAGSSRRGAVFPRPAVPVAPGLSERSSGWPCLRAAPSGSWAALSGTPASPSDPLRPWTWKCAGSDPPRGRLAVVVANTCPGPKPLPALERSSHPRRFSLPPPGWSSRADLSTQHPGSVTVLRLCTTPRRAPRGAGARSVEGRRSRASSRLSTNAGAPRHRCG